MNFTSLGSEQVVIKHDLVIMYTPFTFQTHEVLKKLLTIHQSIANSQGSTTKGGMMEEPSNLMRIDKNKGAQYIVVSY